MKLFVYEAVTGGAMVRLEPSASLVQEADLMLRSLIGDLRELPGITIVSTRDHRLPVIEGCETIVIDRLQDPLIAFDRCLELADAAWVIAPETGGELERLSRRVIELGRPLLSCGPEAVAIAASKRATAEVLASAGLDVVPTFVRAEEIPPLPGLWVVKPDDGAGAEETYRCWDADEAAARLKPGLVAQPWIEGDSLSLSLLCNGGAARLLSVNRQQIRIDDERISLAGIVVNAIADNGTFAELGQRIACAMPGLFGWIGVDLIVSEEHNTILEVNPRVTTSYCGLRAARGLNPAQLVVDLMRTGELPSTVGLSAGHPVSLDLRSSNAG